MSSTRKTFLRTSKEKVQISEFVRPDDTEGFDAPLIPVDLRHGDIVYNPDGYRGTDTWVVDETDGSTTLVYAADEGGYAEITKDIAAGLEDPLSFYASFTDDCIYQGITTIVLSPKIHDKTIRKITGGRSVSLLSDVWWSSYRGYTMTVNDPDGLDSTEVDLNKHTPDIYLCDA